MANFTNIVSLLSSSSDVDFVVRPHRELAEGVALKVRNLSTDALVAELDAMGVSGYEVVSGYYYSASAIFADAAALEAQLAPTPAVEPEPEPEPEALRWLDLEDAPIVLEKAEVQASNRWALIDW